MFDMKVFESNGVLGAIEGKKLWFSRLIAAGLGSSAYYPAEALEEYGARAFPVGTHIHTDHQSWRDIEEQPANSVRTIIGVIASEPKFYRAGEVATVGDSHTIQIDMDGLYSLTEYVDEWAPFVEQVSEFVGLSINASVAVLDTPHESGLPIVKSFLTTPLNTVDLVTYPGAKGKIGRAIESVTLNNDDVDIREDQGMTPEEIDAVTKSLAEIVVPAITEALKPSVEDVDMSEVAEALIEAELPKMARSRVYTSVSEGVKLSEAVSAEKAYIAELKESLEVPGVHKGSGEDKLTADYSVAGWGA